MSAVYLVRRAPMPEWCHAPYHPVIICGKRRVAKWEAGWTGDAAWVWSHERGTGAGGWLLERWNGLDIDYGHVVRGGTLPDGTEMAFSHQHHGRDPWPLIAGAVWWDDKKMPRWLEEAGVVYPTDHFTQQSIVNRVADDGYWERPVPDFWPRALRGEREG